MIYVVSHLHPCNSFSHYHASLSGFSDMGGIRVDYPRMVTVPPAYWHWGGVWTFLNYSWSQSAKYKANSLNPKLPFGYMCKIYTHWHRCISNLELFPCIVSAKIIIQPRITSSCSNEAHKVRRNCSNDAHEVIHSCRSKAQKSANATWKWTGKILLLQDICSNIIMNK